MKLIWISVIAGIAIYLLKELKSPSVDYFPESEWKIFTQKLFIAMSVCSDLAREYKCDLLVDSRWPATGLKLRNLLQTRYIRITLNHNYLFDKKTFFELREHTVVSFPFVYCKIKEHTFLAVIPEDKIQCKEYIYSLLLPLLKKNAPDTP